MNNRLDVVIYQSDLQIGGFPKFTFISTTKQEQISRYSNNSVRRVQEYLTLRGLNEIPSI